MRAWHHPHTTIFGRAVNESDPGGQRRSEMEIRIEGILMPGHEGGIVRILAEDQGSGDQQIGSEDLFHRTKNRRLCRQPVGPKKSAEPDFPFV